MATKTVEVLILMDSKGDYVAAGSSDVPMNEIEETWGLAETSEINVAVARFAASIEVPIPSALPIAIQQRIDAAQNPNPQREMLRRELEYLTPGDREFILSTLDEGS